MVNGDFLSTILAMISSFVGILGIYQFALFLHRYWQRPKPRIGVLPINELISKRISLEQVGKFSSFQEFEFGSRNFATELKSPNEIKTTTFKDKYTRTVLVEGNLCETPIVVQNIGKSNMDSYKLTITFLEDSPSYLPSGKVKIRNVSAETLSVDGLYCNSESYNGLRWKEKIPPKEIIACYKKIGLEQDFVSFVGTLGAGTFEMIYLKLGVASDLNAFHIFFTIDCPQLFLRKRTYGQRILLDRHN